MHAGQIIFSQIMDFVRLYEFRKCVQRYSGNYKMRSFSCWSQFLCMAFAQLTYRESLRVDEFGIELDQTVYALDSSTIDLCLPLFPWARFRKQKGAIKLHTLLDLRGTWKSALFHQNYRRKGS